MGSPAGRNLWFCEGANEQKRGKRGRGKQGRVGEHAVPREKRWKCTELENV